MDNQTAALNEESAKQLVPKLLRAVIGLTIALAVLCVTLPVMVYLLAKKERLVVGITETGRVVELIKLDRPYVNDSRVIGFVDECLRMSFGHDFENYRQTMNAAKACYTSEGADAFERAMTPLLQEITSRSMVMSPSLEATVVVQNFKLAGVVQWTVRTPMTIHRRGSRDSSRPAKFLVTTTVRRIALDENVRGIAISSISLQPM